MKSLYMKIFFICAALVLLPAFFNAQTKISWQDLQLTATETYQTLTGVEREMPKLNENQNNLVGKEVQIEGYFIQSSYVGNHIYYFISNYPDFNGDDEDQIVVDLINIETPEANSGDKITVKGKLTFDQKNLTKRYFKLENVKLIN